MSDNEVQRLALMGAALRPDWPARSLQTFIAKNLSNRTYADVAVALAWVCTRTKTDTPRLLLEGGAWWKASNTDASTAPRPPKRDEACADCGRRKEAHDPNEPDSHEWRQVGTAARDRNPERTALARAELAQIRANACKHGVVRSRTRCADCEKAEKPKPVEKETA